MILIDAGPMVALIHRDDDQHDVCKQAIKGIRQPLLTVGPAIVEAMYLLGFSWEAQDALWEILASGAIGVAKLDHSDFPHMRSLMKKYKDLPMDLADAALLRVAERDKIYDVFTLDRRDFSIYRLARGRKLRLLPRMS